METQHNDQLSPSADAGAGAGMVGQAKEKTQQLVGQAQEKVSSRVGSGAAQVKGQASGIVGNFAEAMRQVGQQYREQDRGLVGGAAERAAQEAQRLAHYLEQADVDDLVRQLEGFARRQPAAFLAGAFAAGVAGARFLKSSRRQRDERLMRERAAGAYAGAGVDDATYSSGASRGFAAERDVTGRQPVAHDRAAPAGGLAAPGALGGMDDLRDSGLGSGLPSAADDRLG